MFARRIVGSAVLAAVLLVGSAAYADFTADLYFTDAGGNPVGALLQVPQAQPTIELVLWDNQVYGAAGVADYIQWVHLNFDASDTASLNPVAHWTWDPALLGQLSGDGSTGGGNEIGKQDGDPNVLWRPAPNPVRIGSLSIPAPAYVNGGDNDHLLSLKGGTAGVTETFVASVLEPGGSAFVSDGTITTQDLTIRIMPEPATIALLGLGAAMTLLRRKRA
jgi:hypothetical protein